MTNQNDNIDLGATTTQAKQKQLTKDQISSLAHIKKPVITILGPTASGKTELAQQVALKIDGEIVSADSMQVYRSMDIGTAKLPVNQRRVPHHLIDVVDPNEEYSAALFQEAARQCFIDIFKRDKAVILCGGTGLYIQAALEDMSFPSGDQINNEVRQKLEEYLKVHGSQALWNRLQKLDWRSASLIHPNNSKRVIRAIEMHFEGISYADQSAHIKNLPPVVKSLYFGIRVNPDVLVKRIDKRVDEMFSQGLEEEVQSLLERGFGEALTASQAIGYKEVIEYFQGSLSREEAIEKIKIASRRYAKRQRSWFRRNPAIIWLDDSLLTLNDKVDRIVSTYNDAVATIL